MNRLLSLFDYTGTWAAPWAAAGWKIKQVDIMHGVDILQFKFHHFHPGHFDVILAAPPCTCFTHASNNSWIRFDQTGQTQYSVLMVQRGLEIIDYLKPRVWALENPTGRLDKVIPSLKKFRLLQFEPWQYGDPFFKHTCIWGDFNPFLVQSPVKGSVYIDEKKGRANYVQYYNKIYPGRSRSFYRSITPAGFAQAFFEANKP